MSGTLEASGGFEVPTPILNPPFIEPAEYWNLRKGEPPERVSGCRPAGYYDYRDPRAEVKAQAAHRWCAAVNATHEFGTWDYTLAFKASDLREHLDALISQAVA